MIQKHISLELAKRIAALAKERGVELPQPEHIWLKYRWEGKVKGPMIWVNGCHEHGVVERVEEYEAYDCAELGEILRPSNYTCPYISALPHDDRKDDWFCGPEGMKISAESEVEARGLMLEALLSSDLFKQPPRA